ncbi:MAG: trigger factor [Candidatus Magasanikbacteria bacterium]|nr:trigger factor [Candidatus Magasanikbacteria bacterium]
MDYSTKKLPKSQLQLNVTVAPEDYKKQLEEAGKRVSKKVNIKGFRKGNVPLDVLKKEVGEMALLQEAVNHIIQETFVEIIKKEELESIGQPEINIEKMAPKNDLVYKAVVSLLPKIKLAETKSVKAKLEKKEITDKQVDETIDSLRKTQAVEVSKTGKAKGEDKLLIDMDMFLDKVPVDGGQSKNYQVYLSEPHYIKGFNEQIVGLKKGDKKEFTLKFPKDHYQKMLAGKKVGFKVKVNEVFERQFPELNEGFAVKLGQKTVEELKTTIKKNLQTEADHKADQSFEIEILDKMIEKTKFDEIPELLIDNEKQKIFYELQRDIEKNGITIEQYLQDIKKTEKELFKDFKAQAEKRAKAALLSREIAIENDIKAEKEEIDAEIATMKKMYKHEEEYMKNLEKPEVRGTIANMVQNRKVMKWLKDQIIK